MILALVLLYVVSLVYISITERFRSYASLVGLQGWLLLAIALVRLQQIEIWSLFFVVAETLLFKAIVVPAILVIENGVFLFSMAVGVEMPSMIEIAIMLDILISILMLGLFLTKIGARFRIGDTDLLTNVKD